MCFYDFEKYIFFLTYLTRHLFKKKVMRGYGFRYISFFFQTSFLTLLLRLI